MWVWLCSEIALVLLTKFVLTGQLDWKSSLCSSRFCPYCSTVRLFSNLAAPHRRITRRCCLHMAKYGFSFFSLFHWLCEKRSSSSVFCIHFFFANMDKRLIQHTLGDKQAKEISSVRRKKERASCIASIIAESKTRTLKEDHPINRIRSIQSPLDSYREVNTHIDQEASMSDSLSLRASAICELFWWIITVWISGSHMKSNSRWICSESLFFIEVTSSDCRTLVPVLYRRCRSFRLTVRLLSSTTRSILSF